MEPRKVLRRLQRKSLHKSLHKTFALQLQKNFVEIKIWVDFYFNLKVQSCKLYDNKYMIASIQIKNTEIFTFISVLVLKLLSRKVLFTNRLLFTKVANFTGQLLQNYVIGMRNFQDTFETLKRSFISAFSICMTVPLIFWNARGGKG